MRAADVPRLVATDLDGTLLHSDGTVTPGTREVLRALEARGVPVVLTTGRPVRWMESLWDEVGGHGLAVCSNGGIVYDVTGRRIREVRAVPRDLGLLLVEEVRAALPGTSFAVERAAGMLSETGFPGHPDDSGEHRRGELADIFGGDVVKVLATHPDLAPEDFWRRVEAVVGDRAVATWSSTFALVEISAAGVTKASTLAVLAAELGIGPDDVVAFGDMPNDLPLLEWAGSSWAMANAHPTVLDRAGNVAPANDEDGVARVLTQLFGLDG